MPVSARVEDNESSQSGQLYLRVAEAVLAAAASPLSAREIVERGIERGLFGDHVFGQTPEKSMQARLSLDIRDRRAASSFMRVARGRFTLRRANVEDSESSPDDLHSTLQEYIPDPRILHLPREEVLCVPEDRFLDYLSFQGIETDHHQLLPHLLERTTYIDRSEAESRNDAKQFITYVMVQSGHHILSFKRSYLSRSAEFLRGARCIGFGGHVSADDADLFSSFDAGLETCARRELSEELGVGSSTFAPLSYATQSLFRTAPLERLGILNDDSSEVGRRHVAAIYRAWVDDWSVARSIRKGEASLRALQWIDLTSESLDLSEFEYWSQLCLRKFYASNVVSTPVVKHKTPSKLLNSKATAISGRIGSGKSEIARYLGEKLEIPVIDSGGVLQKVLDCPPLHEIGRAEFQRRAELFIRSPKGPQRLADALAEDVKQSASHVIIDGIRQPETYEALETRLSGDIALIYVQTPPEIAFEMYRLRERAGDLEYRYRQFLELYDASVEADLPTLGRLAQSYVYNFLGLDALRLSLDKLAHELSNAWE